MSNVGKKEFMDACCEFEMAVKNKYNLKDSESAYMYLYSIPSFTTLRDEIHVIRTLRNMVAHNSIEIDGKEMISFSPALISTLKKITYSIANPILVKDCMITNLTSARLEDSISKTMKIMKEKGLSHIPVLDEENKLLGVFSQSTLFAKMSEEGNHEKVETLEDVAKYLPIDKHDNETFAFIAIEEDIEKAKSMFKRTRQNKKRTVMLFVSKNGQSQERVLGILTPWDVLD